jgi:hypothetical protein
MRHTSVVADQLLTMLKEERTKVRRYHPTFCVGD